MKKTVERQKEIPEVQNFLRISPHKKGPLCKEKASKCVEIYRKFPLHEAFIAEKKLEKIF